MSLDDIVWGFREALVEFSKQDEGLLADVIDRYAQTDGGVGQFESLTRIGQRAAELVVAPARWRRSIGPVIDTPGLADLFGVTRQAIAKWVIGHQILGVPGTTSRLYPTWQLDLRERRIRPVVGSLLHSWFDAEPEVSPLVIAAWAAARSAALDGAAPADLIEAGEDERVLAAAAATIDARTR